MKALCIKEVRNFVEGKQYNVCPVLSGYQVADENNEVTVFLDDTFKAHFEIKK